MIITSAVLQALRTGFAKNYQDAFDFAESAHSKIATVVPSTTRSNTYGWLGQMPAFREWIGDRILKDISESSYVIENKDWESSVSVGRNDIEDDNLGIYAPMFSEMGRAAKVHPDEQVFGLLKDAENQLCYDGQPFFDTDHPVYASHDGTGAVTTVSNVTAGSGPAWYLLDCSRAIKPIIFQSRKAPQFTAMDKAEDEEVFMRKVFRYGVDSRHNVGFGFWQMAHKSSAELTEENFNAAYAAMSSIKADGGRPLAIRPTILVVPPNLRAQALKITKADLVGQGNTNVNAGVVETLVTPWVL